MHQQVLYSPNFLRGTRINKKANTFLFDKNRNASTPTHPKAMPQTYICTPRRIYLLLYAKKHIAGDYFTNNDYKPQTNLCVCTLERYMIIMQCVLYLAEQNVVYSINHQVKGGGEILISTIAHKGHMVHQQVHKDLLIQYLTSLLIQLMNTQLNVGFLVIP